MPTNVSLEHHRALLAHFDSYSAALHFGMWGRTLLTPGPLPPDAQPCATPLPAADAAEGEAVKAAVAQELGLNPDELSVATDFQAGFDTPQGPVRVHLLRFTTFEPPRAALQASGGVFKAISELRGGAREELPLVREVFNLILGAGGGRA